MDTGENQKKKFNIPKKKIWGWIKETVKDPLTLLLFATLWLVLSSPAIFGVIAYWASIWVHTSLDHTSWACLRNA